MSTLKFTDGEEFNTNGELRIERRFDGYYVMGEGLLIPVESEEEGMRIIRRLKFYKHYQKKIEISGSDVIEKTIKMLRYTRILCEIFEIDEKPILEEMRKKDYNYLVDVFESNFSDYVIVKR